MGNAYLKKIMADPVCLNSGSGFKKNLLYFLHHRCGILYTVE